MKKFLTFLITLLVSIFIFNNKVEALEYSTNDYYYINDYSLNSTYGQNSSDDYDKNIGQYYILKNNTDNLVFNIDDVINTNSSYYTTSLINKIKNNSLSQYGNYYIMTIKNDGSHLYVFEDLNDIYLEKESINGITIKCNSCYRIYTNSYYKNGNGNSIRYNETMFIFMNNTPSELLLSRTFTHLSTSGDTSKAYQIYFSDKEMLNKIFKNGYSSIPDINITKERENEYVLNNGNSIILNNEMKINFSSFDTSRYKYLYSYDTENWYEITENDYEFLINKNCSIYVKITDLNDNYINSATYTTNGITENILDYLIEDGTEQGKKLTIYYYNFDNTDYHIVSNFQTGTESIYESELMGTIVYDNINLDNTYSINSYDENDNFITGKVIDIQVDEAKLDNNRYIQLNLDKENKRLNFYYVNYKNNDKCYYKISSEEENEVNCKDNMLLDITKNGYIEIYIKNNNEIVLKRGVNVNFIDHLPQFKFQSYYNDSESKQVLKIVVENLQSDDKIYYSYDKELWNELETKRINYLDFYVSKEVYFKVERNEEIVSEAYFDLVYKAYENSSTNNNNQQYNGLKGLLKYFKDITKNITNAPFELGKSAYELLRQSKFGLYILLIIVSSIIILFIKSIKR